MEINTWRAGKRLPLRLRNKGTSCTQQRPTCYTRSRQPCMCMSNADCDCTFIYCSEVEGWVSNQRTRVGSCGISAPLSPHCLLSDLTTTSSRTLMKWDKGVAKAIEVIGEIRRRRRSEGSNTFGITSSWHGPDRVSNSLATKQTMHVNFLERWSSSSLFYRHI